MLNKALCESIYQKIEDSAYLDDWELNCARSLRDQAILAIDLQAEVNRLKAEREWIPVSDRLPESGTHVLLCCETNYKPNYYICDGFYAVSKTVECSNDYDNDADYDEETDEYYLPEGFYEVIKNWDEYSSIVIGDKVTHWMPLPEAKKAGE